MMSFEDALDNLLTEYAETDPDEIMSALEIKLYAMREAQVIGESE